MSNPRLLSYGGPCLMRADIIDDATTRRVLKIVRKAFGKKAGIWIDEAGRVSAISPAQGGGSQVHGPLSRDVLDEVRS